MKKSFFHISAVLLSLCFISCIKEFDNASDQITGADSELVTIKASISDETATKTIISDDSGEEGSRVRIYWTDYDGIKVNVDGSSYVFMFNGYDENRYYADFVCSNQLPELTENTVLTAEYPLSGRPDLANQHGKLELLNLYHYMTAEYTVSDDFDWEDVSFSFRTQTPIMKITLRNEDFKGKILRDVQLSIDNKIIVSSITTFTASEDTGEIVVYFALHPQEIDNNTSITLTCDDITYETKVGATTTLSPGKLYRISKVMDKAGVIMRYENDKAVITVFDGASADAVIDKLKEAMEDDYSFFEVKGTLPEDIKHELNHILTDNPANTVLTIDGRSTFYVYDAEGLMAWGAAAENDKRLNCTLINDIALTEDWVYCIGTSSTYYSGIFEGNNHVISGLSINQDAERLDYYNPTAMISHFSGEIRNLVLEGGKCTNTGADLFRSSLLIGYNHGIVDGITVGNDIHGEYVSFSNQFIQHSVTVGVIVSSNSTSGIVKNCINKLPVTITVNDDINYLYAGGIVGENYGYIVQCINEGFIETSGSSTKYVGGILGKTGHNKWHSSEMYLCANKVEISGNGKGGLVGYSASTDSIYAGCYTTCGDVLHYSFYSSNFDHCYTMDADLIDELYNPFATYISNVNLVCDEMNAAVESHECEYVDKKWVVGNDYPVLVSK
ncbi:MAG: hypothetical protein E7113_03280 [Bacteroidales bacterium]|nr:hypothetical protein [Bacteroidales bacterium]